MMQSIVMTALALASILLVPAWTQAMVLALGVAGVRYPQLLLIPALVADALYAPDASWSPLRFKMTAVVAAFLIVRWLVLTRTRLTETYGLEKSA